MDAKEYLSQIEKLDSLIANKKWELKQLQYNAEGLSGGGKDALINGELHEMTKVQSSSNQHRMENAVCSLVDVGKTIAQDIARWEAEKQQIIKNIERLPTKYYDLLFDWYVKRESREQIAVKMGYTYRNICYLHGRALQKFQKVLDAQAVARS